MSFGVSWKKWTNWAAPPQLFVDSRRNVDPEKPVLFPTLGQDCHRNAMCCVLERTTSWGGGSGMTTVPVIVTLLVGAVVVVPPPPPPQPTKRVTVRNRPKRKIEIVCNLESVCGFILEFSMVNLAMP